VSVPRFFSAMALLLSSLWPGSAPARDIEVEVEVLHAGGPLGPAELDAMLADTRLGVEALYQPVRLIEGVTARRERVMPIGSKLFAIPQTLNVSGAQVERAGRTLRFRLPDVPPGHDLYRLRQLTLLLPVPPGPGRPQGETRVSLYDAAPRDGAWETARFGRYAVLEFGLRLRHRWSDAQGAMQAEKLQCHPDIVPLGGGQYRFRQNPRYAGYFRTLGPVVSSDPPSRPPAGQTSHRMHEPYPEPLAGWKLSRNHLVRLQLDGGVVERFSIYGEQTGAGACRRNRGYDALFDGDQLVIAQTTFTENGCGGADSYRSHSVEAHWGVDGKLERFHAGGKSWDGIAAAGGCPTDAGPPAGEVEVLKSELLRMRGAFFGK